MKKLFNIIKNKLKDPVGLFIAGLVLGSICFFLSPTHKDPSLPYGFFGIMGFVIWIATVLKFILSPLFRFLKNKNK